VLAVTTMRSSSINPRWSSQAHTLSRRWHPLPGAGQDHLCKKWSIGPTNSCVCKAQFQR